MWTPYVIAFVLFFSVRSDAAKGPPECAEHFSNVHKILEESESELPECFGTTKMKELAEFKEKAKASATQEERKAIKEEARSMMRSLSAEEKEEMAKCQEEVKEFVKSKMEEKGYPEAPEICKKIIEGMEEKMRRIAGN